MPNKLEYRFLVARTKEEIEVIRPVWESFQWHPNGDIDFFLNLLEYRKEIRNPHVILLFENESPVSMIVGRVEDTNLKINFGYKELWRPSVRSISISYGGILGNTSAKYSELLLSKLIQSLHCKEVDVVMMGNLKIESEMYNLSKNISPIFCRDFIKYPRNHRIKSLTQNGNGFKNILSRVAKNKYNNCSNRLNKEYKNRYEMKCYQNVSELEPIMNDSEAVARKTYHRALGTGFFNDEETRKRFDLALRKNWLRVYILYIDGFPVAFWNGMLYKKVFYSGDTGYNPEFRSIAVGTFLLMRMMEDLSNTGEATTLDFGFGDAEYKRHLSDECWAESFVYIFAPSFRCVAINICRIIVYSLSQAAESLLNLTGMTIRIKTYWRNRLKLPLEKY
jgi:hypothetical protein